MASAQVLINGIYYSLDSNTNQATVTSSDTKYTGSVTIPSSVTYAGVVYSVTSIGDYAFWGCSGLTSLIIPKSMTSIGNDVFSRCSGLISITIAEGNPVYDSRENCNAIIKTSSNTLIRGCKNTTIPNSVTTIGRTAFSCCTGLTSVTIPNSVTGIDYYAFEDCTNLTTVSIGNGVTSIGNGAFANCHKLIDVYCYARKGPTMGDDVFSGSGVQFATLHVPELSVNGYRTTEPWSSFGNVVAIEDESYTPTSIYLNYTSVSLTVGDSWQLTASVSPSGAPQSVTWSVVSGSSYVSVSPSGLVTANGAGIAIVRATSTANVLVYKDCVITVQNPVIEGVAINNTNFPDSNFRNWILSQDYGQDGIITDGEFANITKIKVEGKNIQSLKGIEFFANLTSLNCAENQLTSLDLSKNVALNYLSCQRNQLTSLDVSKCTALKELHCKGNLLTSLDVSKCRAMKDLSCYDNRLSTLDISGCTALEELSCHDNNLTTLDVSGYTALSHLSCYNNKLTSLNVSNIALRELNFYQNQIKGDAMDAFIASLPTTTYGQLYAIYFENEGNMMTTAQVAAAKEKGWKTYNCIGQYYSEGGMQDDGYYDKWQEYTGFDPASAINSLAADTDADDSASWYTLGGAQLTGKPTQPGIYIHGGKKVLVK